jgi:hypothetical protein
MFYCAIIHDMRVCVVAPLLRKIFSSFIQNHCCMWFTNSLKQCNVLPFPSVCTYYHLLELQFWMIIVSSRLSLQFDLIRNFLHSLALYFVGDSHARRLVGWREWRYRFWIILDSARNYLASSTF